jgi:hypothetical protein
MQMAETAARRGWWRVILTARAAANTGFAAVKLLLSLARGDMAGRARAVCTIASYAGLLVGAFGHGHEEYARTPDARAADGGPSGTASADECQREATR